MAKGRGDLAQPRGRRTSTHSLATGEGAAILLRPLHPLTVLVENIAATLRMLLLLAVVALSLNRFPAHFD